MNSIAWSKHGVRQGTEYGIWDMDWWLVGTTSFYGFDTRAILYVRYDTQCYMLSSTPLCMVHCMIAINMKVFINMHCARRLL